MRERCPNSHPRGKVVLTDYQLCFDEYSSRWGGGVFAKKVGKQVDKNLTLTQAKKKFDFNWKA